MNKFFYLSSILTLLLFQSCFMYGEKEVLSLETKQKAALSSSVSSVDVSNNLVTIRGKGFANVTTLKIQGNGVDASLDINSKSESEIIARAASAISFI